MSHAKQTSADPPVQDDECWGVVQVASYLSLSYQTARNNMLTGDYGRPEYNATTRKLTVLASNVRVTKPKKKQKKKANPRKEAE